MNFPGSGSSGSSGVRERSKDKPPKLPPRDNSIYGPHNIPKVGQGITMVAEFHSAFFTAGFVSVALTARNCFHAVIIYPDLDRFFFAKSPRLLYFLVFIEFN